MPLELFIALRYLKARRNGVFTMLTTLIAVGGITLGVAALIITLAVMSGFHRDIREKILGIQPHLIILKDNSRPLTEFSTIEKIAASAGGVRATAPFVYGQVILRSSGGTSGAIIKGVDFAREDALVGLRKRIAAGSVPQDGLGLEGIMVGKELARNLGLTLGQDLIVMTSGGEGMIPRMSRFKVTAFFNSGMYEYDANLAFVSLDAGRKVLNLGGAVTGIGVSLNDEDDADKIERRIQAMAGGAYWIRSWQQMNHNLFAALKLEKIMMFIILGLIIIVAAFNIISNLLLLTVEKTREIGILSAMGISKRRIARIFYFEGFIVGGAGIALGLVLGVGLSLLLKHYQFIQLPADVYYLDYFPVRLLLGDVAGVTAVAFIITVLASVYPAYQVTRLDPIEAIRYG